MLGRAKRRRRGKQKIGRTGLSIRIIIKINKVFGKRMFTRKCAITGIRTGTTILGTST